MMKESEPVHLLVFALGRQRFAVSIAHVLRIVPVAQWTPVAGTPDIVLGILDFHGELIAVLDPGQRLAGSRQPVTLADQLMIVRTRWRTVALLVNETLGVIERDASAVSPLGPLDLDIGRFEGATTLDDGLVLIHDIEKFLSPQEAQELDQMVERSRAAPQKIKRLRADVPMEPP